jgi:hypothetical protein
MNVKEDLLKFRLNAWSDLDKYLSPTEIAGFLDFVNEAYKLLLELKPGEYLELEKDVRPENRKLFVQVACLFILENHPDYQFTTDYSIIKRLRINPQTNIKRIIQQLNNKRKSNELERSSGADNKNARGK